jgi:hypothetical protein
VLIDEAGPPNVRVESLRAGLALDAGRKPVFVLAADGVTIGTHVHETLDLSTPDAIADTAGVILGNVADAILDQLGPSGDAVRILLGCRHLPDIRKCRPSKSPRSSGIRLARCRTWQSVVRDHAAAIPSIITTFRDLIADAADAGGVVSGTGTTADPWRVGVPGRSTCSRGPTAPRCRSGRNPRSRSTRSVNDARWSRPRARGRGRD